MKLFNKYNKEDTVYEGYLMLKTADNCEIKKHNYYYIIDLYFATIRKVKCIDISLAKPFEKDYCQFSDSWRKHHNQKELKKCVYRDFNCAKNSLLKKINGLKGFYTKMHGQILVLNKRDLIVEKDKT